MGEDPFAVVKQDKNEDSEGTPPLLHTMASRLAEGGCALCSLISDGYTMNGCLIDGSAYVRISWDSVQHLCFEWLFSSPVLITQKLLVMVESGKDLAMVKKVVHEQIRCPFRKSSTEDDEFPSWERVCISVTM